MVKHRPAHIEESGPARPAKELPGGSGQQVAPDLIDIDRHLADRLAGVEEVWDTVSSRHPSDIGGRVHQSAVGWYVVDGDQTNVFVDHRIERVAVDLTGWSVWHDLNRYPGPLRRLQKGDHIGCVLTCGCEDAVTFVEGHRPEHGIPRPRRTIGERDLGSVRTNECRHRVVHRAQVFSVSFGHLITPVARFLSEVVGDRVQHRSRGKRCAGIVEVRDERGTWRVGSCRGNIDHGARR